MWGRVAVEAWWRLRGVNLMQSRRAKLHRTNMVDVLTVRLDEASQARFETLRQAHFPPERNLIGAHITMFHALPQEPWISSAIECAAQTLEEFEVKVTGLRSLGKGVAFTLWSSHLTRVQADLAQQFEALLPAQDRQRFLPHVVVQNKVMPQAARELLASLEQEFVPWSVRATGLDLWHYLGGPWEHAQTFWFQPAAASRA